MNKVLLGFGIISVVFTMCKAEKDDPADFSLLYGHTYTLKIDRISSMPSVQYPGDYIQESEYNSSNEDIRYEISFSQNGRDVTIEPGTILGKKTDESRNILHYELTEGVFAGGRLIISMYDCSFEAELTIYGSGVPIIRSERGKLEKVEK